MFKCILTKSILILCFCTEVVNCQLKFGQSIVIQSFLNYSSVTINDCIFECRSRSKCKALKYDRRFQYCMLLDAGSSGVGTQTLTADPKITYSEKEWWKESTASLLCADCDDTQVCREGACKIEECSHMHPNNKRQTALLGNMVKIHSYVLYEYSCFDLTTGQYYTTYVRGKCGADGTWDVEQIICYDVYDLVNYRGCYQDYHKYRILQGGVTNNGKMTIPMCASICYNKKMVFFGLQHYSQCFCGTSLGETTKSNNCNAPCSGDKSTICGGFYAMNVYRFNNLVTF